MLSEGPCLPAACVIILRYVDKLEAPIITKRYGSVQRVNDELTSLLSRCAAHATHICLHVHVHVWYYVAVGMFR